MDSPLNESPYIGLYTNQFTKKKNENLKQWIKYIVCKSQTCQYKEDKNCPFGSYGLYQWCVCPNGKMSSIDQPKKGSKGYSSHLEIYEKIRIRNNFKDYSKFVWENRNQELDQYTYNHLKDIPEFQVKNITEYWETNSKLYAEIDKNKNISSYAMDKIRWTRYSGAFFTSFKNFAIQDINNYIKKIHNVDTEEDKRMKEWEIKHPNIFRLCGEYVFLDIPWLRDFEKWGVKPYFCYTESNLFSGYNFNAVKVEDFEKIYDYLVGFRPFALMGGEIKEYRENYVPYIKKEFPKILEQIKSL